MTTAPTKPLNGKAYGHIGHLVGSRMGTGDHHVHTGQARIATEKARDRHDEIIVQEKLDGSCCAVARIDGVLHALGRAGWPASSSKYEQHQLFAQWVWANQDRFLKLLNDGERAVGEWLAQVHSTRYNLPHEPFVLFDIMRGDERMCVHGVFQRNCWIHDRFTTPYVIHRGGPFAITDALKALEQSHHGAIDPVEGAVWRVERQGKVDFLAKYVRPEKVDGIYLPEVSGQPAVWNWRPEI